MIDHYKTLGLNPNSTTQEIKTAYRKLSKKFHPDVNQGDKFFEERFKEIQEAYENLCNEDYVNSFQAFRSEHKTDTQKNSSENASNPSRQSSNNSSTKSPKTDENSFSSYRMWGFIILGIIAIFHIFRNYSTHHPGSERINSPEYVIEPTTTVVNSSPVVSSNPTITWNAINFNDVQFELPNNMTLNESLSSRNFKSYVDFGKGISLTIVQDNLTNDLQGKTIEDFAENIEAFANSITEEHKKSFHDAVLLNYRFSTLGNSKSIEVEELSTEVSASKNIEMVIISHHLINRSYYKITFVYPRSNLEFENIFNKINKSFVFINSIDEPRTTQIPQSIENQFKKVIYFKQGKSNFYQESFSILQSAVAMFKEYPNSQIVIEGNTDSEGSDQNNNKLALERALVVKSYLIENGISSDRISCIGNGESKPIQTNMTENGKRQNNRVEIKSIIVR